MKMNYLSGDNKGDKLQSKLGKKLSNRYLSSDAFTSSAGRSGVRTVSRLGSILKKNSSKKYYGVGQKLSLFEFKDIFFKVLVALVLIGVLVYTVPFTRYATHRFFTKTFVTPTPSTSEAIDDTLGADEAYVSPQIFKTDAFSGKADNGQNSQIGTLAYDAVTGSLVGAVSAVSGSSFEMMLFSDPMYKGNFFTRSETFVDISATVSSSTVSESPDVFEGATSTATDTSPVIHKAGVQSISFEGVGYGQLLAKIPPQTEIELGTEILAATPEGLKPIAVISHVEPDAGSSFTLVYAQLLVPPTHIYKIRLAPLSN